VIHLYYTDLIELTAALVFLVVFKIVLLLGMGKMSSLVSEEPVRKRNKPKLSADVNYVRWAVSVLLLVSAVWQVRPVMLFVSSRQLVAAGSFVGIAQWWVAHALWLNIWSVVIQLSFAALLLSFSSPLAVRLTGVLLMVYSLVVWVTLQGFGHLHVRPVSMLTDVPGTALLFALSVAPLVFQSWKSWRHALQYALAAYWLLFFVLQWWPSNHFWNGTGYSELLDTHPAAFPSGISALVTGVLHGVSTHAKLGTLVIGLVAVALSVAWIIYRRTITTVVSLIVLLLIWVFVQGLGFGGAYAFSCGTAPLLALWVLMARSEARGESENV